jgi:acetyl esterase/lipase
MLEAMLLSIAIATCALLPQTEAAPELADPVEAARALLVEAVDLPDPAERRKRARELAKLDDFEVQHWLAAAQSFGEFEALTPGEHLDRVALWVEGKSEETDLHWFVPSSYDPAQPTALILGLHGAGGSGRNEMLSFRSVAEELGCLVLAPTEAGANFGYGFSERERQSAMAALRWMRRRANVDENRVHLTGVSRGGHYCFDLARFPSAWASVAPRIGGPALAISEGRNNIRIAVNFAHLPMVILQGMGDQDKLLLNQELALERLKRAGSTARRIEYPEHGHSYDHASFGWETWFDTAERKPFATKLTLASARKDEGELLWLQMDRFSKSVDEDFQPRVDPGKWNAWSHAEKARFIQNEADERTARIDAEFLGEGRFQLTTNGVTRLRLLLPEAMLGERGAVSAIWKGKERKKKLKPNARVLLEHFVEHFDRAFLPVAAWELR